MLFEVYAIIIDILSLTYVDRVDNTIDRRFEDQTLRTKYYYKIFFEAVAASARYSRGWRRHDCRNHRQNIYYYYYCLVLVYESLDYRNLTWDLLASTSGPKASTSLDMHHRCLAVRAMVALSAAVARQPRRLVSWAPWGLPYSIRAYILHSRTPTHDDSMASRTTNYLQLQLKSVAAAEAQHQGGRYYPEKACGNAAVDKRSQREALLLPLPAKWIEMESIDVKLYNTAFSLETLGRRTFLRA